MGASTHKQQTPRHRPFKSQQLELLSAQFCLQRQEVQLIYQCFTGLLSSPKSYLELDDLALTLHNGYPHCSQLPYLQRLFILISRRTPGKLFFQDYLTGISTFCLMNAEAILHFVFDWLDSDGNDRISKEDILTASQYKHPANKRHTFFNNFVNQLERTAPEKWHLLDFQEFRQLSNKLLFLIWPAYQLQEKLREINLGGQFWKKQYMKIQKAELALKNSEKKASRILDKVKQLSSIKLNKNSNQPFTSSKMQQRKSGIPSTDLQLLQTHILQRRKSCPYLMGSLTVQSQVQPDSNH